MGRLMSPTVSLNRARNLIGPLQCERVKSLLSHLPNLAVLRFIRWMRDINLKDLEKVPFNAKKVLNVGKAKGDC